LILEECAMVGRDRSELTETYIIQGGDVGRERLRVLSRAMRPSTMALFEEQQVGPGMHCLDLGCGGGDVTLELARLVAPAGRATGVDVDATVIAIASGECAELGLPVTFEVKDVERDGFEQQFDVIYARFILSHLRDPVAMLARVRPALRPGGVIIAEDIDQRGSFCWPANDAFDRYVSLYSQLGQLRGVDPYIGPRLPSLLRDAGYASVEVRVVQPVAASGDVAHVTPLTMAAIAPQVVSAGLATEAETAAIVAELEAQAADPAAIASFPRVVQAWARA
jgi:ubiquinone/menaquinone biosynthesis C-methylase UbiE